MLTISRPLAIAALFTYAALLASCGKDSSSQTAPRPKLAFPVETFSAEARRSEFSVHSVGSVEAYEIVPVTARVAGVVEQVKFREGDVVSKGRPLVDIEPSRYALNVRSAEADLEKAKATLLEAQAGLSRRRDIQAEHPGWVSHEEMQDWETRVQTLIADSARASVALDLARLNQRDAGIPAPSGGVIQSRSVQTGQYLSTGAVIATIVRRDPLLLRLTVPEQESRRLNTGLIARFTTGNSAVEYSATITSVTEAADPATRMVTVIAEIDDEKKDQLRPGTFVEATILLGEANDLPVIPQTAIRPSERGFLAFVVKDSVAEERILKLGLQTADGLVEVREGIQIGEKVVARGAEALRNGAVVKTAGAKPAQAESKKP
ncbi:efflux RND transporter periplasmic adaptor subunit [bacterium]|nr:efflux RND transporter periplasmic adaptor subunit [bacterium]